jgi:hypothetical protein
MQKVVTPIPLLALFIRGDEYRLLICFLVLLLPCAERDAAGGQHLQVQVASAELAGTALNQNYSYLGQCELGDHTHALNA